MWLHGVARALASDVQSVGVSSDVANGKDAVCIQLPSASSACTCTSPCASDEQTKPHVGSPGDGPAATSTISTDEAGLSSGSTNVWPPPGESGMRQIEPVEQPPQTYSVDAAEHEEMPRYVAGASPDGTPAVTTCSRRWPLGV